MSRNRQNKRAYLWQRSSWRYLRRTYTINNIQTRDAACIMNIVGVPYGVALVTMN